MRRTPAVVIAACLSGFSACGQEDPAKPPPPDQAATQAQDPDPVAEMLETLKQGGIDLDLAAKTITLEGEVGRPDQPLEYLLGNPRGKAHETMFLTEAKASLLNGALIALGLEKGKNARIVDKDPMPTIEEVRKGAPMFDVFPPEGEPVYFTVKWEVPDGPDKGQKRELPVEELILDITTEKPVVSASWIYLGGNLASIYRNEPPVFLADFEGNLVSVVYKSPPNHLVTMRHARAGNDQIWWFSDNCPPPGTAVELTLHRTKPALVKAREARLEAEKEGAGKESESKAPAEGGKTDGDGR